VVHHERLSPPAEEGENLSELGTTVGNAESGGRAKDVNDFSEIHQGRSGGVPALSVITGE